MTTKTRNDNAVEKLYNMPVSKPTPEPKTQPQSKPCTAPQCTPDRNHLTAGVEYSDNSNIYLDY